MLAGMKSALMMFPDTVATPSGPVDPYYANVYGLWHLDTDFADSGPAGRPLQATNTTTGFGLQSAQVKFGTGALQTSAGPGTFIRIPANASLKSTNSFTIEFWMRSNGTQSQYTNVFNTLGADGLGNTSQPADGLGICNWTNAAGTGTGATTLTCWIDSPPNQLRLTSKSNPNNGAWHHIALVRNGNTMTLFFDGVNEASGTYSRALDLGAQFGMVVGRGTNTFTNNVLNGFVDDIRITLGVARYTSNFSVPTAEHPNNG